MSDLDRAARAVRQGDLVVYPTETVYGLGADALSVEAVERVYELKGRAREKPLSMAVPDVDAARPYVHPTERDVRFMREFLPGPVTVVVERDDRLPDALTAGRSRVGVRIPDHDLALQLLEAVHPVTATSANRSGQPSVRNPAELDDAIRNGVAAIVDGGETPGVESTVVDPERGEIHRRGALADEVERWLADH